MSNILFEDTKQIIEQNIEWDKLKNATVLVTGAAGMIGSYITRTLLRLEAENKWGMEIYVLVRHPEKLSDDIREEVAVIKQSATEFVKTDVDFDFIIHTAGPASPLIMKDRPVETIAANVLGTYYTLELARKSQAKGYLFISSREIYGQPYDNQNEFYENTYGFVDPLSPRSCYPEGKKAAETMCVSFAQEYGLNVKIARLAHTYGPGMSIDDGRVQADFLRDIVNNRDIVMKSEGKPIRTYTYVSDAVAAIFYILLNSKNIAYNISSPESTVSIRELAETLVDAYKDRNIRLVTNIPKTAENMGTAPFTLGILNSEKLRGLGWMPRYTLKEGLVRTVEYLEGARNR